MAQSLTKARTSRKLLLPAPLVPRTPVGGTATGTAPCLRASNLAGGNAFEFASSGGPTAGLISIGDPAAPNRVLRS